MSSREHKGMVHMQPSLDQSSSAMRHPTPSHSILHFGQKEASTNCSKSQDRTCDKPGTGSMKTRVRLRAETGALAQVRQHDSRALLCERNKIELILDAKRSQLKKMQQLSRLRFINKLISPAYLDELADEIVWQEALLEKAVSELQQSNAVDDQINVKTASPFPPATTGTSN
jgi:hypothetical protein